MVELAKDHYKVTIMGTGPAGLTAGIYAARANLEPILFEGPQPGGQLTITTDVENYPGFPDGIMGPEFIDRTRQQTQRFGAEIKQALITEVDADQSPFKVTLEDGTTFTSDTFIIASGASARLLGLDAESELMGYGVSTCATCDGFFFREKEICVVGGGDSAMEEAIFLTKFASKVTIIHRRDELRASKIMQDRAMKNDKIVFLWDTVVTDVLGNKEDGVQALKLENVNTEEVYEYPTSAMFVAIGHIPNTHILEGIVEMDQNGYILTEPQLADERSGALRGR